MPSPRTWKPQISGKGFQKDYDVVKNPFYDYIDEVTEVVAKTRNLQENCLVTLNQLSPNDNTDSSLFQTLVSQLTDCGPLGRSAISFLEKSFGKCWSSEPQSIGITHLHRLKELVLDIKIYPGHLGDYADGPTPSLERGMVAHAKESRYASTKGLMELKQQVCLTYKQLFGLNISHNNVWVSPGESFAMWLALQSMIKQGQKVGYLRPLYPKNLDWIKDAGGIAAPFDIGYPAKFDKISLRRYFESEQPTVMIWTDPHNPTGFCLSDDDQRDLLSLSAEFGVRLLVDAAYEFVRYGNRDEYGQIPSMLRYADYCDSKLAGQIVHAMTLGKGWRGNGYRIAVIVGEDGLIQNISSRSGSIIGSVATPMQYAAVEALKCLDDTFYNTEILQQKRDIIAKKLQNTHLEFELPKATFYYFFDVSKVLTFTHMETSDEFCKVCMTETGIAMIPGSFYGFNTGVRLSFAALTMEDINNSMEKLRKLLDRLMDDWPTTTK